MWSADLISLLITGLFSCHCLPSQYHFVSQRLNWTEAQKYCRAHYSDLATIENQEDHSRFIKYIEGLGYPVNSIWIGMYYNLNSWSWSLDKSSLEETDYKNWAPNEPEQKGENCVFMNNGMWGDRSCYDKLPYLCYNANKMAPNDYVLMSDRKSWSDAQKSCRQMHTDLASVRNHKENNRLVNIMSSRVWIGLFRDRWKWSNQNRSRFTAWLPTYPRNGPNPKCAFYQKGGWADDTCGDKKTFMCQSVPYKQLVKLTIKTDSTLNMEDPEVQASIAEQIRQKLQAMGNPDTRVTWRQKSDGKVFHKKKSKGAKKRDEL